jgi:NADPH2:quinone reductase
VTLHLEFMGVPGIHGINREHQGDILRELASLIEAGTVKPVVSHVMPLDRLADGHRQQATGHTVGKIVLEL